MQKSLFTHSRRRLVAGRWIWILIAIVAAVLLTAAACSAAAIAYCNNCSASANANCVAVGKILCAYQCNSGVCGGVGASCGYECCVPPTATDPETPGGG